MENTDLTRKKTVVKLATASHMSNFIMKLLVVVRKTDEEKPREVVNLAVDFVHLAVPRQGL